MMMMMMTIVEHTPVWVWGLLAALLALGYTQSRARRVRQAQILALPAALLAMGLWSLLPAFAAQPLAAAGWAGALAATAALGRRLPRPAGARWDAAAQRLHLPGSWLPMALIVCIFSLRYATGVALALHPERAGELPVQLALASGYGALSGLFLGRALGLLGLTRGRAGGPTIPCHGQLSSL